VVVWVGVGVGVDTLEVSCLGASCLGASTFLALPSGALASGSYSTKFAPTSIFCCSLAKIFVITPEPSDFISTYNAK
jgi:hypothetical protein